MRLNCLTSDKDFKVQKIVIVPIIPDIMRSAKKSTMIGVELVDRQWGNIHASRCFDSSAS